MGRRGPKPTPTALLKARGSWRGKKNKREPKPTPIEASSSGLDRPDYLTKPAAAVWDQVVGQLVTLGLATRVDVNALARYCDAMVRWRAAAKFIAEKGEIYAIKDEDGHPKCFMPFPQVAIYANLSSLLSKLEAEFGLTPASRTRLQVDPGKAKPADTARARLAHPSPGTPVLRIAQ